MLYKDNVIIKKGWFPDTFKDIDDSFCFVNLDMDLYLPQLAALKIFWDKTVTGGILLLHNYFQADVVPGTKKAVAAFEKELGRTVSKTPIGDGISLAIIKD
jgi:hypothetical protein